MILLVEARDQAIIGAGVDDIGILGVWNDKAGLAAADFVPIRAIDDAVIAAAGDSYRGIVLLRSIDSIRKSVVGSNVVELRGWLIRLRGPALPAVVRYGGAAIVRIDHPFRMSRIDPQAVVISMRSPKSVEGVTAVGGTVNGRVQHVDRIHIFWIGEDVMEVPGALREAMIWIDELPGVAGVLATVDAALLRFDDGIDAISVGTGDGYTNPAKNAGGKPVALQPFPGRAIVDGLIKSAAGPAADGRPGVALCFVKCGEQDVWIGRIEGEIDGSGLVVFEENLLPGLAAIAGFEDAARFVGAIRVAHRRDIEHIRICGVHNDSSDVPGVLEADVIPGLAAVQRLVHAVAVRNISPPAGLAGAHVDYVRVGGSYGHCAN